MLLKNVLRTLRGKWMQLAAIGVIIVFSSMIYTMMSYGLSGIAQPTTTYLEEYAQEDFSVEMLNIVTTEEARYPMMRELAAQGLRRLADIKRSEPATFEKLIDGRIRAFEELYPGVEVELRQYKIVEFEHRGRPNTALVAKDAQRVNLSYLEGGVRPTKDNEIALNRVYAEKNGIAIGDSFAFKDRPYRVTGYVLFPDYTLTTFDNSFKIDTGLQPLVLLTDSAYADIGGDEGFRLAGITRARVIDTTYDKDRLPFVTQIVPTATNIRSGAIYDELTQGRAMSLGLSVFIAAIAVIIVSIMMSNLLNAERGQIGILKALGYRRIEIALPYFQSVVGMAFFMLIIGYVLGTYLAEPLKAMYLDFYILPRVQIAQDGAVFATAIFVPLFFFALFSGVVIYRMLGESSLALLKPHETASLNRLTRYVGRLLRKSKGSTKFKYLHALRSTGSFVVFFIGIMFSTILITFAFMMDGMVDRMTVGSLDSVAYRYQAYADFSKRIPDPKPGEEKFLVYPYAYVDEKVVSLQGLSPDNALYNLYGVDGSNITTRIRNNVVISRSLGLKLGIGEGDRIGVRVNARQHDFVVAGVADETSGDQVYLDIRTLSRLVSDGESSTLFSGVYSLTEPSSEYYSAVISKKGLLEQSQAMATYTDFMINIMIGSSAVIAASILFVLTAFTVERNYFSISLLKVLGYSRREVNSMILDSYLVYSLLSYALSVPIALAALDGLMGIFLEEYDLVVPLEFRPLDAVKGLVVLVGIFLAGTYASRKKIERIPLQEVLKTYGE